MLKRLLIVGVLAALVCGGAWLYHRYEAPKEGPELLLYGNVDVRQVNLGFRVYGRVEAVLVDEGDRVSGGQVLARLDSAPYWDELMLARAKLAKAQAQLNQYRNGYRREEIDRAKGAVAALTASLRYAEIQYVRNEELVRTNAVSESVRDQSLADRDKYAGELELASAELRRMENGYRMEEIQAAAAQVAAEESSVRYAELNLSDCVLYAKEPGIVQVRIKEPGAMVAAGAGIITETLDSPVWVRAYVPEPKLGRIHTGMPLAIYTDSDPHHPVTSGRIGFISPIAEFTPKNVETATLRTDLVYRIRIVAENPRGRLLQGMPVTIKIPPPAEK